MSSDNLRRLALIGLEKRGLSNSNKHITRLYEELDVINGANLADFFLNTSYIILKLKSNNIPVGSGRGSVGGSLVAYCLKITEIDPLKYDLSFSRFLNKARAAGSMPDIDTDVTGKRRQEVIDLIKDSYGSKRVYQVINQIKYTIKTAIKDCSRIFKVPFSEANKITSLISDNIDPESIPEVKEFFNKYPMVYKHYKNIIGLIKSYGIHAGGLIILPEDIENYCSILKINGAEAICFNGKTCDALGTLKNDVLGLSTLDIIQDTIDLISNDIVLPKEFNDNRVFDTINKSTLGIFQLESTAASDYTKRLKPQNFNDIVADLALVRPGAQDSGDADIYVDCKNNGREIEYDHPLLEPILKDTYGCILFQEQAMAISRDLAGFTDSESDILRKGIGKKIQSVFDEYHPKFIQGCINNGISEDVAQTIWDKIEKSSKYSFNKSHSVGYSILTYHTAWLKTHYPIEFYISLLNNTKDEDKRMRIYNEIKGINKNIKNPDINISKDTIVANNNDVYLSFSLIKGVGEKAINDLIEKQPYHDFNDFLNKKDSRRVNKRVVKALIESGAFDSFGERRDVLYANINDSTYSEWDNEEMLFREFNRLKINPAGNLLDLYDVSSYLEKTYSIAELNEPDISDGVYYSKVIISSFSNRDVYGFLSITDNYDNMSLFISKSSISRYIDTISIVGEPILAKISVRGGKYSLISLLALKDIEKYQHEFWSLSGRSKEYIDELQEKNPGIYVGYIDNISSFISKKGNPCAKYDIIMRDSILKEKLTCGDDAIMLKEGSFIFFFYDGEQTFINLEQVL